nr:unnamed protein product [Naegleria fowleri]
MEEVMLPPLESRKERTLAKSLDNQATHDLFILNKEEIYEYDIKDMKMTSSREVRHNPNLAQANAPPPKKTKVTFSREDFIDPIISEGISVEDWMKENENLYDLKFKRDEKRGKKIQKRPFTRPESQSSLDSGGMREGTTKLPVLKDVFLKEKPPSKQLVHYLDILSGEKQSNTKKIQKVAPDDEEEISKLKTGDDAVAFFSKAGKSTAVKFVYLNRADSNGVDYRPYDLVVVPKSDTNPEYFTMSSTGVVHICPGQPTEYMSLSEWMKESTMFNVLRRIRFFKYYLVHKCFRLWYQNARYLKYSKKRLDLAKNFFLAKKTFSSSIMKIHKLSYDLQYTPIMDLREKENSSEPSVTIEQFHEAQKELRSKSSKTFDEIIEKMEEILVQLCEDVTSRSRVPDMNASENIEAYLSGKIPTIETEDDFSAKKSKSMVEAQEEEEKRQRALKKAREEADMLGNFIRVSDYMAVESLVTLSKKILDKFKVTLQETKSILFLVNLLFKQDGSGDIVFEPSEGSIMHVLQSNSDEIVTTVSQVPRLLYMRKFKVYFDNMDKFKMDEHLRQLHVGKVLQRDEVFNSIKSQIEMMLHNDFLKALEYGKDFEGLKYWYKFGKDWDEKYAEKRHTVQEFTDKIKHVNDALLELKRMNFVQEKGILFIDSKQLRNTLQPIMENIYEQIKLSISITSREMCLELNKKFVERVRIMKEEPTKLKDFAKFIDNHNKIRKETRQLMIAADEVEKMNELAAKNKVEMERADQVALESLKEIKDEFLQVFKKAELYKENNMSSKKAELEENVQKVSDDLLDMMTVLRNPPFVTADADPVDVLERLSRLGEEIAQFKEKTEIYKEYQVLLEAPVKEWTNLTGAETQFNIRSQIWKSIDEFSKKSEVWDTTDIQKQEISEIEQEVEKYYQLANELSRFGEDDVIRLLKKTVQVWKDNLPVILLIGNKDLKPHHWEQIFKGMGKESAKGASYTLRQLSTLGIFMYKDLISEVSTAASAEAALYKKLEYIAQVWRETDLDFKALPHRKDFYILNQTEPIQRLLDTHKSELKEMLESKYVTIIRTRVEDWIKKLDNVSIIFHEWLSCQRRLLSLEYILTSDLIKKEHPEDVARYISISSEFKDLISKTSLNRNVLVATHEEGILDSFGRWNMAFDEIESNIKSAEEGDDLIESEEDDDGEEDDLEDNDE